MQILQWLFEVAQEEQNKEANSCNNKQTASTVQKPVSKDLILYNKSGSHRRSKRSEVEVECEDHTITCFYSTLNLKILGNFHKSKRWMHEVIIKEEGLAQELRMGNKGEAAAHVGNKVLPISDATVPTTENDQCGSSEKRDKPKGNKAKAISRMKDLLRWAAASKSEKGGKYISRKVLYFGRLGALKSAAHDNDSSISSPKISFRWDVGSCSYSSSAFSGFSFTSSSTKNDRIQTKPVTGSAADDVSVADSSAMEAIASSQDSEESRSRRGNWITTDDEFVVLEL